jgi:hypothetical protein
MFATHTNPDLLAQARQSLLRADLYRPIHKALRAYMADVLQAVGALDVDDPQALDHALMRTTRLLDQCAAHLEHENAFLHPAIDAAGGGAAQATARDHDDHCRVIAALRQRIAGLRHGPGSERPALALSLYRELALFIADNLQHMQTEEGTNNAALWAAHDDAALHAVHARLLAKIAPQALADMLPWLVRSLNPGELADLFGGMRQTAPASAFRAALELARAELDDARFGRLSRSLGLHPEALAA